MEHLIKISSMSRHGCNFPLSYDHGTGYGCQVIFPVLNPITPLAISSVPEFVSLTTLARQRYPHQRISPLVRKLNQVESFHWWNWFQLKRQNYCFFPPISTSDLIWTYLVVNMMLIPNGLGTSSENLVIFNKKE